MGIFSIVEMSPCIEMHCADTYENVFQVAKKDSVKMVKKEQSLSQKHALACMLQNLLRNPTMFWNSALVP